MFKEISYFFKRTRQLEICTSREISKYHFHDYVTADLSRKLTNVDGTVEKRFINFVVFQR